MSCSHEQESGSEKKQPRLGSSEINHITVTTTLQDEDNQLRSFNRKISLSDIMSTHATQTLDAYLKELLPDSSRSELRSSVLPLLLHSISGVARCLRTSLSINAAGSTNTSGDSQLNVDLATNEVVHAAVRKCPSIVAASSEEDEGENRVEHDEGVRSSESGERYAVAFDPLDGSSIIPANWTVGTIIGIWDGETALNSDPRTKQVASMLGVLGPRTTAIVAIRLPESDVETVFEVGIGEENAAIEVIRKDIKFTTVEQVKTRYFAPANLRAAAEFPAYAQLVNHYISSKYTLRYSGGLVPDIVHALVKGHGVYISPVTSKSKAKLRRLYELAPIALIIECAGGKAVEPVSGTAILDTRIGVVDETSGLICGTKEEVDNALKALGESS
jgi:sedoheptulose-bisphosphatase